MSELWVIDARFENLRRILESLIAAESFPRLHSVEFTRETVLRAIWEFKPGLESERDRFGTDYRETVFFLVPQRDDSTRIEIHDDPNLGLEPLAWGIIWNELKRTGHRVKAENSDSEITTFESDPWVDLEEIERLSHRKIIRALKDDYHSNRVRTQAAIAAELGVSPGTVSTVKSNPKYLRTNRKILKKSEDIKDIKGSSKGESPLHRDNDDSRMI